MPASVNYRVVGTSAPFSSISVKDPNGVDRFINNDSDKIYFTALTNGIYKVTVTKGSCTVTQEVLINNCTPVPVTTCSIPILKLNSVDGKTASFTINNIDDCKGMDLQYSENENFNNYQTEYIGCVATRVFIFPANAKYYVRVAKTCVNNLLQYSPAIAVVTETGATNCVVFSGCKNISTSDDYDTYRIELNNPASQDITFNLSNGTIIIVPKGRNFVEQVVPTTNGCPTILSNNINITNCQNPIQVYNLKLCDGNNASRQLINTGQGFTGGEIIYDKLNKICYSVVGLGAQVSSLITDYEEGLICGQGLCNPIPTPITPTVVPSVALCCLHTITSSTSSSSEQWFTSYTDCNGQTITVTGDTSELPAAYYIKNILTVSNNILITKTQTCI